MMRMGMKTIKRWFEKGTKDNKRDGEIEKR